MLNNFTPQQKYLHKLCIKGTIYLFIINLEIITYSIGKQTDFKKLWYVQMFTS